MKSLSILLFLFLFSNTVFSQSSSSGIKWVSLEEAQKLQQTTPKKIFIDIYTDWCGWCKKLDAYTYQDKNVIDYINSNFYAVKLNAETRDTIFYNGSTYTYNPAYKINMVSEKFMSGSNGYPTVTFVDEKLNVLSVVPGYLDAKPMLNLLKYFGDGIYLDTNWTNYQKGLSE